MIVLRPIESLSDISPEIRGTPIEDLIRFHNLGATHSPYSQAEVLVGMYMDHRERLSFPENFAYIIRAAGCNLRYSEFQISYAVAIGGVSAIALVGHTNCGMVNLMDRRELFISRLVQRGGWQWEWAETHFMNSLAMFEIGNEIDFLVAEARRLRGRYPTIPVTPLIYRVEDHRLYHVNEQWVLSDATGGGGPAQIVGAEGSVDEPHHALTERLLCTVCDATGVWCRSSSQIPMVRPNGAKRYVV